MIDVRHVGRERVIGAWEVDGVVVDPGPEPCLDELLRGLGGERPRALLLTHIHLDHAGAAGALVERFPGLAVYVHEAGAPHLADPSRLLASAARLYGDDMERLWGRVLPVPAPSLRPLAGGEVVEAFRVAHVPGHAGHHVAYLHEASGDAYVGDVAGVRIPPHEFTVMPTPPPEIDVEAWRRSLARIAEWRPRRLRITHFGMVDDADDQLRRAGERLERQCALATGGQRAFLAGLGADIDAAVDAETADLLELAVPARHCWLGLERHLGGHGRSARAATLPEPG